MLTLWTPERVDTLRMMWADGASFSEIANALACGLTRNACIGKASRLGLGERKPPRSVGAKISENKRDAGRGSIARRIQIRKVTPPVIIELPKPYNFLGVSLLDLKKDQCRFPQGEGAGILFCGNPTEGGSWCAHCRTIVFSKVSMSDSDRKEHGRIVRAAKRSKRRRLEARAA